MLRSTIHAYVAVYFLVLSTGCRSAERVESHPLMGRFQFLWYDDGQVRQVLTRENHINTFPKYASMGRDSKGDRLFINVVSSEGSNMLAVISAEGLTVKNRRGFGPVNDAEEQVCWLDSSEHRWHFQKGLTLEANEQVVGASGAYVAIADNPRTRQWIASTDTPKNILIPLPTDVRVVRLFARDRVLDLFYFQSQPKGGKGETDEVLHLVTYSLDRQGSKEERHRMFPWASGVFDMDPKGKVAVFRPKQTYFAHGVLAELDTGRKFRLGVASDNGVFLREPVIRRFHELSKH